MDFLKDIVKEIGDDYTQLASNINESEAFVDTGSFIFNALCSGSLHGGISDRRITAIAANLLRVKPSSLCLSSIIFFNLIQTGMFCILIQSSQLTVSY